MKVKAKQRKVKGETYDYCADFMILSALEKRTILFLSELNNRRAVNTNKRS